MGVIPDVRACAPTAGHAFIGVEPSHGHCEYLVDGLGKPAMLIGGVRVGHPIGLGIIEDLPRAQCAVAAKYMYETSYYYPDLYAMHRIYEAGGFGKLVC